LATANAIARAAQSGNHFFQQRGVQLRGLIGYEVLKRGVDSLLSRGQPVCQVTYKESTSDTTKVMREVCRFLEIPYRDELADLGVLIDLPSSKEHIILWCVEIKQSVRLARLFSTRRLGEK